MLIRPGDTPVNIRKLPVNTFRGGAQNMPILAGFEGVSFHPKPHDITRRRARIVYRIGYGQNNCLSWSSLSLPGGASRGIYMKQSEK